MTFYLYIHRSLKYLYVGFSAYMKFRYIFHMVEINYGKDKEFITQKI